MNKMLMADADEITVERGDILDLRNHLDFTRDRLVSMMGSLAVHQAAHPLPPETLERLCEVSSGLARLGGAIEELYWTETDVEARIGGEQSAELEAAQ